MDSVVRRLEISPAQAGEVLVATVTLYVVFVVMLRLWGLRARSRASTGSIAAVTVMGSLVGRSMLGDVPNLGGGLLAFTTVVLLETVWVRLRRQVEQHPAPAVARPVVVAGRVRADALAAASLAESELAPRLRRAGVTSLADVALAVLEPDGSLTVVQAGRRVDSLLVGDVDGADALPDDVVRRQVSGSRTDGGGA